MSTEIDWTKTCWHMRFSPTVRPCAKPAKWMGPPNTNGFVGVWRACDEHRQTTDVPLSLEGSADGR